MRRVYRAFGGLRLVVGAVIFVAGYLSQGSLGFGLSVSAMLLGTVIALSGAINVILVILGTALYAVTLYSLAWVISFGWEDESLVQFISGNLDDIGIYIGICLVTMPVAFWYMNRSWWLMADQFSVKEPAADTIDPDAFDLGRVELCGDYFFAAVTLTHQGIILDRRNHPTVVLPWRWIKKIKPILEPDRMAELALQNDDGELLLVDVPWKPGFLGLVPDTVEVVNV